MKKRYLIVGLGNPGKSYENTRHNIGFAVLDGLVQEFQLTFRSLKGLGEVAKKEGEDVEVWLLKPSTYMNLSGQAVMRAVREKNIPLSQVLIIADDVALKWGVLRLRAQGSSGGHNGLKSIEECLGTQEYARLRIGVSTPQEGEDLSDYVLGKFSREEKELFPKILERAKEAAKLWLEKGIIRAMEGINAHPPNPSNGETNEQSKKGPL